MKKEFLKTDGHYTKKEINKIVEEAAELTKEDLDKLRSFIFKDIRIANEIYLSRDFEKFLIKNFVKKIKDKRPDIFENLVKFKVIDKNGNLEQPWSGVRGVKFVQIVLNNLGYRGLDGKPLTIDGIFGPNTAWALLQYQLKSRSYKEISLNNVIQYLSTVGYNFDVGKLGDPSSRSTKGRPDLIVNGRVLYAMMTDLGLFSGGNILDKHKIVENKETNRKENKKEEREIGDFFEEVGYVKDGRYYIIGKDGEPKVLNFDSIAPEYKEKLKEYRMLITKIDSIIFVIDAFKEKYKDDKNKLKLLNQAESKIKELNLFDKNVNKELENILVELSKNIDYRFEYIKNLLFDKVNYKLPEDIEYNILWFTREDLKEYSLVSRKIINDYFYLTGLDENVLGAIATNIISSRETIASNLIKKELKGKVLLDDEDIENFIKDVFNLKDQLTEYKKDHLEDIEKQARKLNMTMEEYEILLNKIFITNSLKYLIFRYWLKERVGFEGKLGKQHMADFVMRDGQMDTLGNHRKILELFSDIEGLGWFNPSDKNIDLFNEILQTALIELAALGTAAIGAEVVAGGLQALAIARWTKRGIEIVEEVNRLRRMERLLNIVEVGGKAYRTGKKVKLFYELANIGVKGVTFYEIANAIQNIVEGRDIFEGTGDLKEIGKTILMIGVFEALGKLIEKVPGLKIKEGESFLKKTFKVSGQVILEGISLGAIGGGIDVVLGEGEWNTEMFIEGIIMAIMLRLAGYGGRIVLRKIGNKIVVFKGDDVINELKSRVEKLDNVQANSHYVKDTKGKKISNSQKGKVQVSQDTKDKFKKAIRRIEKNIADRKKKINKMEREENFLDELGKKGKDLKDRRREMNRQQLERINRQILELDKLEKFLELLQKNQLTDEANLKELGILSKRYGIDYTNKDALNRVRLLRERLERTRQQLKERLSDKKERIEKLEDKYKKLLRLKELQKKLESGKTKGINLTEAEINELIRLRKELGFDKLQGEEYFVRLNKELEEIRKKIEFYKS